MPRGLPDLPARAAVRRYTAADGVRALAPPGPGRSGTGSAGGTRRRASSTMRFVTWPGGLRTVLDALLADVDVEVRTGTLVTALMPSAESTSERRTTADSPAYRLRTQTGTRTELLEADGVVLAVPAWAARRLLAPLLPRAADTLSEQRVASTAAVVLGLRHEDVAGVPAFAGNGLLVGSMTGTLLKAVTNLSAKWPHYAGSELFWVRLSAGRDGADLVTPLSDAELVDHLRRDLRALTGLDAAPRVVHVQRWRRGLPQLTVGHVDRIATVRAEMAAALPGVELAGAAYDGIGLPACLASARRAARHVLDALDASDHDPVVPEEER